MISKNIETLIFDLEGVIVNSEIIWDESHKLFNHFININDNINLTKTMLTGKTLKEGTVYLKNKYKLKQDIEELINIREKLFLQCLKKDNILYPGFIEFYNTIKIFNIKTCIATSLEKRIFDVLEVSTYLYSIFENKIFFCSEHVKRSKPAPDIFIYAAKQMGTDVSRCIVIEDSPNGILASKSALIGKTIALCHTFHSAELNNADYIYNTFADIDFEILR